MNANSYLTGIVKKYSILAEERLKLQSRVKPLYHEIRKWGKEYIIRIIPSGSFAKGTAVKGGKVDIDLLISLKNQTPFDLKEIYESLYKSLDSSYCPRKQNVSVGITYNGVKVDLVPAKKQPNVKHPHSIYVSKFDTWTKTNIHKHINIIRKSPHRNIIKLFKIWCKLNEIDFPSFLLELTILEALKKKAGLAIERKSIIVLKYIIEEFEHAKIFDPANSNNIVSDSITNSQKTTIINAAISAYESDCWERIIWGLYEIRK